MKGRKRHLLADAGGLLSLAHVHAANLRDHAGAGAMVCAATSEPLGATA